MRPLEIAYRLIVASRVAAWSHTGGKSPQVLRKTPKPSRIWRTGDYLVPKAKEERAYPEPETARDSDT